MGVDLLSPHAEKIGIFVDVQNIYYTTRDAFGRSFNYRALWQILSLKGDIVVANAYATDRNDESQRKFQSALRHIGFSIRLKPYIQRADALLRVIGMSVLRWMCCKTLPR